jgi:hypothetical protein
MARVTIISHWCKLIENFQTSPLGFYDLVKQCIDKREVPDTVTSRVEHHEGGIFAAKREYLRVQRKNLAFDICAAPFGTGFFFSSWFGQIATMAGILLFLGVLALCLITLPIFLNIFGFLAGLFFWIVVIPGLIIFLGYLISEGKIDAEDTVLGMPVLGPLYNRIFHPFSYHKLDTIQMYQTAIHAAVIEAIDEITKANGIRGLTELERKPVMKDFLGR